MQQAVQPATFSQLVHADKPVLVDFYADWCSPCKLMAPILSQVKEQLGDRVHILKVDVDSNPKAASAFGIQGVPTLILFRKGEILWRQSGVMQAHELVRILSSAT
jgi:thioredoxin 1